MSSEPAASEANPPTDAAALVASARRLDAELAPERAEELLAYLDAMLLTNQHINLTAVRDREQAVVLHALDSLAFARCGLQPHQVLDIGTGNGFPGVGIAALHPHATVILMDRTGKKVRAVGTCLVSAGLDRVETVQMDAAQASGLRKDFRHAFDLVAARAVARPEAIALMAQPLVRPGGHMVLWLDSDAEAPEKIGRFQLARVVGYDLPAPAARTRRLGVWLRR